MPFLWRESVYGPPALRASSADEAAHPPLHGRDCRRGSRSDVLVFARKLALTMLVDLPPDTEIGDQGRTAASMKAGLLTIER